MADAFDYDSLIDRTTAEIGRLASIADGIDPAAPVPSCPGWTVSKLLKHTGTLHRMVTKMVSTRSPERIEHRSLDLGLPESPADYPAWLVDGGKALAGALREAGPDSPVWTWSPDRVARWWARRMLHETAMHRADGELAAGRTPEFDQAAAIDGIDELLAFAPLEPGRAESLATLPAGKTLHLHTTDTDADAGAGGEWLIRFTGETGGMETSHGHAKATAAVRGPASRLLLFAYGRISADDESLSVFGDRELAVSWQDKAL